MRNFYALLLLLSMLAPSVTSVRAQSRPRRVGQNDNTASQPAPTPTTPDTQRRSSGPPTLGGVPVSNDPAQRRERTANTGPEEVDENEVVRVNTTLVTIPVTVLDRDGKYVPSVRQDEFRIFEDGVQQDIAYFAAVEKPFTVALVLDNSTSTRFKLDEIQDAATAFVEQLRPEDRVMVVAFTDTVRVLAEPTSDRRRLRDAIRQTRNDGNTSLYDAVDFVIHQRFNRIPGRKAIVLFTDGVDTSSQRASYEANVRDAEELDAVIYPIQYDTYQDTGGGGTYGGGRGGGGGGNGGSVSVGDVLGSIIFGRGGNNRRGGGGSWPRAVVAAAAVAATRHVSAARAKSMSAPTAISTTWRASAVVASIAPTPLTTSRSPSRSSPKNYASSTASATTRRPKPAPVNVAASASASCAPASSSKPATATSSTPQAISNRPTTRNAPAPSYKVAPSATASEVVGHIITTIKPFTTKPRRHKTDN